MILTNAQLQTLKADIAADSVLNAQPQTADGAQAIADAYNLTAAPDFWVWRTSVTEKEIVETTTADGTVWNWTGTGFIGRTSGELAAWRELFGISGTVNPSLLQVRNAFADILSGNTAPAPANRTHLLTMARRRATRGEKLFASGTGSTASPATMALGTEGRMTYDNVLDARALP